jgi:DNA polymerase-3 subunit epsilon
MNFIALDVETANADLASVCQIGIAQFSEGRFTEKWESLVNPEDEFDAINVAIHGIDESTVARAPTFPALAETVSTKLIGTVVASHTPFDQSAVRSVFAKYEIKPPVITWLDTARVVRRTWPDLSKRGYGLAPVAERLGIQFRHHDAAEDARAAGEILLHAIRETGLSVDEWVVRAKKPISSTPGGSSSERITREGNPEGPFFGEVAVFTGVLSMPRRAAADLAASAGCEVAASVTKASTLLIVGDQDIRKLAGQQKSKKHRKAEELIKKGQKIRILRETDFRSMAYFGDRSRA